MRWNARLWKNEGEGRISVKRILVTGGTGQIGYDMTLALRKKYGGDNVVCGIHRRNPPAEISESGPCEVVDCTDISSIRGAVDKYGVGTIYHLAAMLSAISEADPKKAWSVNFGGLYNALEVARELSCSLFFPSSMATFGPETPKDNTPQDTIQRPTTIYGVAKVAGELMCNYYFKKYGVDTRGVRYPGVISSSSMPGGGTTDYSTEIFYAALTQRRYVCYLRPDTMMPMLYMPDAVKAAITLMEAEPSKLVHRNGYNVTAMSFTPQELAEEIKKRIPGFEIEYDVDPARQAIADSWPNSLDDSCARKEWGWTPDYDLETMAGDIIKCLSERLGQGGN